jgi:AraC-like DNA-binding protein
MDLQFAPRARAVSLPVNFPGVASPYGRLHIVRHGFFYAGLVAEVSSQRHSALLYLALKDGEFTIETPGSRLRAAAARVGPGVRKRLLGGAAPLVCLDICPTHRSYRAFAQAEASMQALPRAHFTGLDNALRAFHDGSMGVAEADHLYTQLVTLALQCMPAVQPIDPRVREVMRLLRERRRHTIQELAEAVCLSKDWLVHLFQREAGISLRKYEQALKIQAAAAYLKRGVSMTELAAIAGFADSAHFSKMWKQHYGFPPNRVFGGSELMTIDPMPWPSCIESPITAELDRDAACA